MIIATILHLHALAPGHITGGTGRAVHGFWHHHWQAIRPAIADALHQGGTQPFTLTPLMDLPRPHKGSHTIAPGTACWLRLTVLQPDLAAPFLEEWLPRLPAEIELAGIPWRISRLSLSPAEHPWARQAIYPQLHDQHLRQADPPHTWRLTFETPTTFRSGRSTHLPFPLPDALVESWQRRWQAFSPMPLPDGLRAAAREHLHVSAYNLHTVPVRYGRRLTIGCVGHLTLHGKKLSPSQRAAVSLLADYAFFAGSGFHTTQGMGLTRLTEAAP